MNAKSIVLLGESILEGHLIRYEEASRLTAISDSDIPLLAAYANKIRERFVGNQVDMCGIINARSGLCSEDCKFCAQSARHKTTISVYPLLSVDEAVSTAKKVEGLGAKRVSLVTSGKGMENDKDFPKILTLIDAIARKTSLKICANLGTLTTDQALTLAAAGVKRYAHNLETSEHFYPSICSTHSYQDRLKTLSAAKSAGMELCCGGIIGIGETWSDRLNMAFALRQFDAQSVPINILNPIKGTALENAVPPSPLEIVKTFSIFRLILPKAVIRPAGGRELNLRDMQGWLMLSGANGLIIGNYLTFTGRDATTDFKMVQDAGLLPG